MIRTYIDTLPGLQCCPVYRRISPESICRGQAQGQESSHAKIDAAGVDVFLTHVYLTAGEAHTKPSVSIERMGLTELTTHDRRECAAYLCRINPGRKQMEQGCVCQRMKRTR